MSRFRRAVSEVISTLVILLIVSVLGTSLYGISLASMRSQQESFQGEVRLEVSRAMERMKVVHVGWDGSSDLLNLTVLNYGKLDLKISEIYMNGEAVTSYNEGRGDEFPTLRLGRISFTSPISISSGNLYQFVLVTERGVSHAHSWQS